LNGIFGFDFSSIYMYSRTPSKSMTNSINQSITWVNRINQSITSRKQENRIKQRRSLV